MGIRSGRRGRASWGWRYTSAAFFMLATLMLAACGSGESAGGGGEAETTGDVGETSGGGGGGDTTVAAPAGEETGGGSGEMALAPAGATVGPDENSSMLPAGGKEKDPSKAPPENPPEGVQTFPATSNRTDVELPISYEQDPPTNGDHSTYWLNCGFYSTPVENEPVVHSMDHGAVWITYRPDLPAEQVEILRGLAREDYVLVSPYPGLRAPVVATAWRNQLELTGTDDPRLRQFVDQFRLTTTAPLSGNGCTGGRGEPEVS